jgi:translation initiation factor 4G
MATQILLMIETADATLFKGVVKLIFEKALWEPKFNDMYAELCRQINDKCPEVPQKGQQPLNFRAYLLGLCQAQFNSKPEAEDPRLASLSSDERDLVEFKKRRRILGNVNFISSLFKIGFVPERVLHGCVKTLLDASLLNKQELEIECLCKLLTCSGSTADTPRAKAYIDAYFKKIQGLQQDRSLAPRLRFMLMDLMDLRAKNWVTKAIERKKTPPSSPNSISMDPDDYESMLLPPPPAPSPAALSPTNPSSLASSSSSMKSGGSKLGDSSRGVKFAVLPAAHVRMNRSVDVLPSAPISQPGLPLHASTGGAASSASAGLLNGAVSTATTPSAVPARMEKLNASITALLEEYLASLELEEVNNFVRACNVCGNSTCLQSSSVLSPALFSSPWTRPSGVRICSRCSPGCMQRAHCAQSTLSAASTTSLRTCSSWRLMCPSRAAH